MTLSKKELREIFDKPPGALTTHDLQWLKPHHIKALSVPHVSRLTTELLLGLTAVQILALTQEQIKGLTLEQMGLVPSWKKGKRVTLHTTIAKPPDSQHLIWTWRDGWHEPPPGTTNKTHPHPLQNDPPWQGWICLYFLLLIPVMLIAKLIITYLLIPAIIIPLYRITRKLKLT